MSEDSFYINGVEVKQCRKFPNYCTSKDGNVYRISTGRLMAKTFNKDTEYNYCRLCHNNVAQTVRVSHIVANTGWVINPNPDLYTIINHKDGNKLNDSSDNLEWCTLAQNQKHAVATGLKQVGSELYNSVLNEEDVHEVCKRLQEGFRVKDIADEFSVSKDIVRKIKAGDTYFHVRSLYNIPHKYVSEFSEMTVRWVCEQVLSGYSDKQISENCSNRDLKTIDVKRIRYKIRYKIIVDEYF